MSDWSEKGRAAWFQRHRRVLEWAYWPVTWSIGAVISATSVLMEYQRRGDPLSAWEPFVWEFSSVAAGLVALLLVIAFDRRFPLTGRHPLRNALAHLGFSTVYCLVHVLGMVAIRHLAYHLMDSSYDFGNWGFELFYEYRKDVATYLGVLLTLYLYRYLASRIINEARAVSEGDSGGDEEHGSEPPRVTRLLVSKLGKDFLLRVEDIAWVEAAGNYMNLHVGDRVYPLRETLTRLERRLDPERFLRIHRSTMVNLDRIETITPLESGDAEVRLRGGATLRMSRRYRDALRERLRGADEEGESHVRRGHHDTIRGG